MERFPSFQNCQPFLVAESDDRVGCDDVSMTLDGAARIVFSFTKFQSKLFIKGLVNKSCGAAKSLLN